VDEKHYLIYSVTQGIKIPTSPECNYIALLVLLVYISENCHLLSRAVFIHQKQHMS